MEPELKFSDIRTNGFEVIEFSRQLMLPIVFNARHWCRCIAFQSDDNSTQ